MNPSGLILGRTPPLDIPEAYAVREILIIYKSASIGSRTRKCFPSSNQVRTPGRCEFTRAQTEHMNFWRTQRVHGKNTVRWSKRILGCLVLAMTVFVLATCAGNKSTAHPW